MQWMKQILKQAIDVFLNGADMVVEEDRSGREGITWKNLKKLFSERL